MNQDSRYVLLESLRRERNLLSSRIGDAKQTGEAVEELIAQSRLLTRQIRQIEAEQAAVAGTQELSCSEARTVEEVLALREPWQALQHACPSSNLYSTWEWLSAWYEAYAASGSIRCLLVHQGSRLVGLAPLFSPFEHDYQLQRGQLGYAGSYGPAWGFYPEFLLWPGQEEAVMQVLLDALCEEPRGWWNLKFMRMQTDGPTLSLLMTQMLPYGLRTYAKPGLPSAVDNLPDDPDRVLDMISNSNHRNHCRSARRHLLEDLPQVRFRRVHDPQEAIGRLDDLARLNIMRHDLKGIQSNFLKPAYRLHFDLSCQRLHEAGYLQLHIIEYKGETIAASTFGVYRDQGFLLNSGFLPGYGQYRPSHLIILDWMAGAITEGVRSLDMLSYYPYKSEICKQRKHTTDLVVFPDSLHGLLPVAREVIGHTIRKGAKSAHMKALAASSAVKRLLPRPVSNRVLPQPLGFRQ